MTLPELEAEITRLGEKSFRAKQIYDWLHKRKVENFDEMTNISSKMCTVLDEKLCIKRLKLLKRLESVIDNTVKYLYELPDGGCVESVLMEYDYGLSVCLSTQVGCKMGCRFCASAIAGFVRSLEPSEILQQYYSICRECSAKGKRVGSIVLMGIGEPLDNFDNVLKFLGILSSPEGDGMSLRHVTLSTCGIVPAINKLSRLHLGLTLSVSLHAADDRARNEIMPVNRTYNISKLLEACRNYVEVTGRRITFEYAVINGKNSNREDALRLSGLLKGINCHVNLIPVNTVKETGFKSSKKEVAAFQKILTDNGINATVRRTLGSDINAACGQLRRTYEASKASM